MRVRQPWRPLLAVAPALLAAALAGCATNTPEGSSPLVGKQPPLGGWEQPRIQLNGLVQAQLEQLLGPPYFKRTDGPARLLQYRDDDCVLDVFVYDTASEGEERVAHVEARDHGLREMSESACLSSLLRNRRTPPAS